MNKADPEDDGSGRRTSWCLGAGWLLLPLRGGVVLPDRIELSTSPFIPLSLSRPIRLRAGPSLHRMRPSRSAARPRPTDGRADATHFPLFGLSAK